MQEPGTRPEEIVAHVRGTISLFGVSVHVDLTVTRPDLPGPAVHLNLRAGAPKEQK